MNTFSIIADKKVLDTYDDLGIAITYEIEDILSVDSRSTNWTKTIILPGSAVNNKLFHHIFDVNIELGTFNPKESIPTVIRIDDEEILKGNMQLLSLSVEQGLVEYEVTIFGTLTSFKSKIENKYMRDLDLSKYNHIRNQENIKNSIDYSIFINGAFTSLSGPGEGYVYPYIVYGGETDVQNRVFVRDLFPAVYVKTAVDALFDSLGMTVKSQFFQTDYFKSLILPFTGDKLQITDEDFSKRSAIIGVSTASEYIAATGVTSSGSNWTVYNQLPGWERESGTVDNNGSELTFKDESGQFANVFTCANAGYYSINFDPKVFARYTNSNGTVEYSPGSGSFEYLYRMELVKVDGSVIVLDSSIDPTNSNDQFGTQLFSPSDGAEHSSPWIDTATPITMSLSCSNILLEAGDKIRVHYEFRYPQGVNWSGIGGENTKAQLLWKGVNGQEFSVLSIEPSNNESLGNEIVNMNQILPENYKQLDFISDLIKMFNLVIVDGDDPNTLIMEPRDDYYASKQEVLNWDEELKLDYDSEYKITPMSEVDATSYLYSYSEDFDYYNQQYTEETKKIYGQRIVNVQNDFSDRENSTKVSFASSVDSSQFIDGRVAPFFVKKDDENFLQMKVKPRILFYGGRVNKSYLILQDFAGQALEDTTVMDYYGYAGMWDHPTEPNYDLAFGSPDKIYWSSDVAPNYNLVEKFHKTTLNNIIDPNAKLLEGMFRLSPRDIANFDFRKVVYLLGHYWRVNVIKDYNPVGGEKLTNVVLYTINDVDRISSKFVNVPVSNKSCPADLVLMKIKNKVVQTSKSGQVISADCCAAVGGNYVGGVCYMPHKQADTTVGVGSPISDPTGPNVIRDGNILLAGGVKVHGSGNYVPEGTSNTVLVVGNNNGVPTNVENVLVIGNNVPNISSNSINIGGTVIDSNGNIRQFANKLQGPRDQVRNLFPDNPLIGIWKSGTDSVRDVDFTSVINLIRSGRDSI